MESEDFFREGIFNQDLSAENGPTRSSRAQALQAEGAAHANAPRREAV